MKMGRPFTVILTCIVGACLGGVEHDAYANPRVLLSPPTASLAVGDTLTFRARELKSDETMSVVAVSFAATGGTITKGGVYVAGRDTGRYRVVAAADDGARADTASITLTPRTSRNYSTTFGMDEYPIRDHDHWINGGSVGLDWADASVASGLAIGHQSGPSGTDATAILRGTWRPDQQASARVFFRHPKEECFQELELRLRSTVSAHVNSGYEVTFRASRTDQAYIIIARWNGPVGNYTFLFTKGGPEYRIRTGDVIAASIVGDTITAYRNGVAVARASDTTFVTGSPGMGFNLLSHIPGCAGTNRDYGFTSFAATDFVAK
jgi:hypothetical protein